MNELDKLKAVCASATPGPWAVTKDDCAACGGEWDIYDIPGGAHAKFSREEDAAFIETFNPKLVKALLGAVEALEPICSEFAQSHPLIAEARQALSHLTAAMEGEDHDR